MRQWKSCPVLMVLLPWFVAYTHLPVQITPLLALKTPSPAFITSRPGILGLSTDIFHNKLATNGPNNLSRNPHIQPRSEYNTALVNFEQLLTYLNSIKARVTLITLFFIRDLLAGDLIRLTQSNIRDLRQWTVTVTYVIKWSNTYFPIIRITSCIDPSSLTSLMRQKTVDLPKVLQSYSDAMILAQTNLN